VPRPRAPVHDQLRPPARKFVPIRWGLLAICAVAFAVVAGTVPALLPIVSTLLFVVIGSALMRPWYLLLDTVLVGAAVTCVLTLSGKPAWSGLSLGLVMIGTIVLGCMLRRDRTGVAGAIGSAAAADAMLVDLRDRALIRSAVPPLPPQWRLDTDLRSAHGESFSGDFVVTAAAPNRLEVVLVDVSGNGQVAGGRALLLASALEALLDAVPSAQFLPAANQHVLRHGDDDGFATAVRVSLDLETGEFVLTGAGHPPAAHYRAGSGRWLVLDDDQGPALGLMADAVFPPRSGLLGHGDALLLYTDGLVESRRLDVGRGIDRLIGHADTLLARGVDAPAARIAEAIRAEEGDDRALVVIRRI
jgi:Stage II sporulation protein E (SpoIIE)